MTSFKFFKQPDQMDCGPTCLRMVARHHGRSHSIQKLRGLTEGDKHRLEKKPLGYDEEVLQHWLKVADVHATPWFFLNAYRLPDSYRLDDIKHLIQKQFKSLYPRERY